MASLAGGTYVVRNVQDTSLVMDSVGGTDVNGANVALGKFANGDGQFVRVFPASGGTFGLIFPATGKVADVPNNDVRPGANVQQYDWNGSGAQRWLIEEVSGKAASYGGKSYQAYRLVLAETKGKGDYVIETYGGSPTAGTNVCIVQDGGAADQMWIFVPANPMPTGTYRIVPAYDTTRSLAIGGSSQGTGAKVITYPHADINDQKLWLRLYDREGRAKLAFAHSLKLMETMETNVAHDGALVCQCADYGGTDQQWVLQPGNTSVKVNGAWYPTFRLSNFASSGYEYVLGVKGGSAQLVGKGQGDQQRQLFALVPEEAFAEDLPTPSSVGLRHADGTLTRSGACPADGSLSACWSCEGKDFKARYRTRERRSGGSYGVWGPWRSVGDGSTSNDGWGTLGRPNQTFSSQSPYHVGRALSLPMVSTTAVDTVDVQLQVRRFSSSWKGNAGLYAHGGSGSSGTIRVAATPTMGLTGVTLGYDGVTVGYSSDWSHGGCSVNVSSVYVGGSRLSGQLRKGGLWGASGGVTIPWGQVTGLPAVGSPAVARARLETDALSSQWASTSGALANSASRADPKATVKESDHATWLVTVPRTSGSDAVRLLLAHASGRWGTECKPVSSASNSVIFEVMGALGVPGKALALIRRTNGTWGASVVGLPAITGHAYVWTWDGGHAVLDLGSGAPATMDDVRKRDYEQYSTTGRARRAYRFTGCSERSLDVSGVISARGRSHGSYEAIDGLLDAGHALFRSIHGDMCDVAVVAVSHPRQWRSHGEVKVTQYEEVR
nr:RICIN domain-containing protein [uncultured Olsenella sp.]